MNMYKKRNLKNLIYFSSKTILGKIQTRYGTLTIIWSAAAKHVKYTFHAEHEI